MPRGQLRSEVKFRKLGKCFTQLLTLRRDPAWTSKRSSKLGGCRVPGFISKFELGHAEWCVQVPALPFRLRFGVRAASRLVSCPFDLLDAPSRERRIGGEGRQQTWRTCTLHSAWPGSNFALKPGLIAKFEPGHASGLTARRRNSHYRVYGNKIFSIIKSFESQYFWRIYWTNFRNCFQRIKFSDQYFWTIFQYWTFSFKLFKNLSLLMDRLFVSRWKSLIPLIFFWVPCKFAIILLFFWAQKFNFI